MHSTLKFIFNRKNIVNSKNTGLTKKLKVEMKNNYRNIQVKVTVIETKIHRARPPSRSVESTKLC